MKGKRVMIAPLDWGLGHATRCIPIINELLKRECEIWIASSGMALDLLRKEFPATNSLELISYDATYSGADSQVISTLFQLPKFLNAINAEHKQIELFIEQYKIELVISDNRYGCWTKKIPCIFITHQLNIIMPSGLQWLQPIVRQLTNRFVKRFTTCWVPDVKGSASLAGDLSNHNSLEVTPIGILSRFNRQSRTEHQNSFAVAAVLSGPEPQRTLLENIIKPQLLNLSEKSILVRGVIESETKHSHEGNLNIVNFLISVELEEVLRQSSIIIARSGYSTIMDIAVLERKPIFIPTPGQTEQEYLARRLMDAGVCFSIDQNEFDLNFALQQSKGFSGFSNIETSSDLLCKALDEALTL